MHPHSSVLRYSRTVGGSKELSYCSVNFKNLFQSKVIKFFKKFIGEYWPCLIVNSSEEEDSLRAVEGVKEWTDRVDRE